MQVDVNINGRRMDGKWMLRLVGRIFLGITVALLITTAILFLIKRSFINRSVTVDGVITDMGKQPVEGIKKRGVSYVKTTGTTSVEYEYKGEKYAIVMNFYSSTLHVGEDVKLRIDPEKPDNANVVGFEYLACIITGGISLVFLVISTIFLIVSRRRKSIE